MKKLLYVEFSSAHTEIIYSFLKALEAEYEVTLLIHEKSKARVENLPARFSLRTLSDENYLSIYKETYRQLQPESVLLNSTQGRKVRNLVLNSLFSKSQFIGVHHNPENLYKSFTQKIINLKFKKYIVLAEFIKLYLKNFDRAKVESFYPLRYHDQVTLKPADGFHYFCVPGVLELARRDYLGLIDLVHLCRDQLPSNYRFVFLGNCQNHDGLQIKEKIVNLELRDRFILFDEYVLDQVMLGYVQKAAALLPLITPRIKYFKEYFETKISGCYSLAFSYQKPLLMDEVYRNQVEFAGHAVYFSKENFFESLQQALAKKIESTSKFDQIFQDCRLLEFLRQK